MLTVPNLWVSTHQSRDCLNILNWDQIVWKENVKENFYEKQGGRSLFNGSNFY